jgi:hypothetical protein
MWEIGNNFDGNPANKTYLMTNLVLGTVFDS